MKRFIVIGLVGLAMVVGGIVWAWLHLAQNEDPDRPAVVNAPASEPQPAATETPQEMRAPPISAPELPSFDVVRVNPAGDAVIAGRAVPNAQVIIMDGEREIGRAQADGRGEWVFVPSEPLPSGARELSLSAQLPDGSTVKSDQVVVLAVPERGQDVAGRPATGETSSLAVAMPRDGGAGSRVLQGPADRSDGASRLTLETIDYGERGHVALSGRAPPGSEVQVYLNNKSLGRAVADANGNWTLVPGVEIAPGTYTVRVDQLGPQGKVAARIELPFMREAPSRHLAATAGRVIVQPGNSLWRIARRTYGEGMRFVEIYEANKAQIRDPDLIYPGQVFVLPQTH
ncbi:MAG TPA: LysM peptidoglycan-binding domain-containing protein [Alphaproteobacteria bacterium]